MRFLELLLAVIGAITVALVGAALVISRFYNKEFALVFSPTEVLVVMSEETEEEGYDEYVLYKTENPGIGLN